LWYNLANNKLKIIKHKYMNKIFYLFVVLALFGLIGAGCALLEPPAEPLEPVEPTANPAEYPELANPASVYCVHDIGGKLKMYENEDGVSGYCLLPDGRLCEEWKLFNNKGTECMPPEVDMVPVN